MNRQQRLLDTLKLSGDHLGIWLKLDDWNVLLGVFKDHRKNDLYLYRYRNQPSRLRRIGIRFNRDAAIREINE